MLFATATRRFPHGPSCNFVDDIDFEAGIGRRVERVFEQLAHVVDLGIGSGVELDQVDEAPRIDLEARRALAARLSGDTGLAVERLGNDARQRGLADAARTGKQIRVMQSLLPEGVGQCRNGMFLADQLGKRLGPPLAGEDLGHGGSVSGER